MDPTEFYQSLLQSISDTDTRKVARIMSGHVGQAHKISLEELTREVFQEFNTSTERKTREILEILTVTYRMPICSISGKSGRWLASNEAERDAAAMELEARGRNTLERARALRMSVVPAKEPGFDRPKQQSLWR